MIERNFQDLFDFFRRWGEIRPPIGYSDYRMQREAADEDVNRSELAENSHTVRVDSDFFGCFAQRRLCQCFSGIGGAAWKADLSGMSAESASPHGQRDRWPGLMGIQKHQRRGLSGLRGNLSAAPGLAKEFRREPHLCLDSRQGRFQTLAQARLNLA